ncbi:FAD-dependent monooxygenase [Thermogemmatispora sp.]|uniref:FAD-dependent monooxygenase n=1 Tax=Thermogemmatispora sp. TaxID=1968838 RepID=UPI0035E443D1
MSSDKLRAEETLQIPVLIVGGSLVGLSLSLFLSWRGVASLVVERHPELARLPRARALNPRAMELFRWPGLEETIRAAQSPIAGNTEIVRVESLAGRELMRINEGGPSSMTAVSPTTWCLIDQDHLEPILYAQAKLLGGDIRLNTELVAFTQDESGVSATIVERTTGKERHVRARYLIAADGANSQVRRMLGITTQGPGSIAHVMTILFEADLREALRGRRIMLCYVNNPALPDGQGMLMPIDNQRLWSFNTAFHPERGERREDLSDERCIELIRLAVGIPDLAVKILPAYPWDPVKVNIWELAAQWASHYHKGRVFLAGDAAHTTLPSGSLGAGAGIEDAFNLAWKLALVLAGKAGSALLESYEEERLPIGTLTVEQTLHRFFSRTGSQESTLVDDASLIFGFRYRSGALVPEPGSETAPLTQHPSTLSGEAGTRAPQVILERNGSRLSSIDLFGKGWVLLTVAPPAGWEEAVQRRWNRLPLLICPIGPEESLRDVDGSFLKAYSIGKIGAVLVRPDGVVAWRTTGPGAQTGPELERVLRHLLSLR